MKKNNNKEILPAEFLQKINSEVIATIGIPELSEIEAQEAAQKIISTLPILVRNYFIQRKKDGNCFSSFSIYYYNNDELTGVNSFHLNYHFHYECFKQKSIGYYLCKYLDILGFTFFVSGIS